MTKQVSRDFINAQIRRLNRIADMGDHDGMDNGKYVVGAYMLSSSGRRRGTLVIIRNEDGGETEALGPWLSYEYNELSEVINAYIRGYEAAQATNDNRRA